MDDDTLLQKKVISIGTKTHFSSLTVIVSIYTYSVHPFIPWGMYDSIYI